MREGVVIIVEQAARFLMIRRSEHVIAPGAWCFVGGGIEPGETQEDAIVREFREEVNGMVRPVRKVWEYETPDKRAHLHWWLADLEGNSLQANPEEVAEMRWLQLPEIVALPTLLDSNRAFLSAVDLEQLASVD